MRNKQEKAERERKKGWQRELIHLSERERKRGRERGRVVGQK